MSYRTLEHAHLVDFISALACARRPPGSPGCYRGLPQPTRRSIQNDSLGISSILSLRHFVPMVPRIPR